MQTNKSGILVSIIIGVALIIAAAVLGGKFKNFREGGVVTVKGVAEDYYNASVAEWRISVAVWGETSSEALQKVRREENRVEAFLKSEGFSSEDFSKGSSSVTQHYEEYQNEHGRWVSEKKGFNARGFFNIRTKDLERITNAYNKAQEISVSNEAFSPGEPAFYLEGLEEIKRKLISKATQDARLRAEEFCKNNSSKVGDLKSASQGTFDISSASSLEDNDSSDYYGGGYSTSTIEKKVRLVVTIQYSIEN